MTASAERTTEGDAAAHAPPAPAIVFGHLAVRRVEAPTPGTRRIVLGGADLAGFDVPPRALGPYVKLFLPRDGGGLPQLRGTGLAWPEGPRAHLRTYSVRRHDFARGELWIDLVLHGNGPAARWARGARPGESVAVWGPGALMPPGGAERPDWFLLAGDHAALPAIAYVLENLPAGARGRALVEVPDAGEEQALRRPAGMRLDWLHRPPGAPSGLAERVRAVDLPAGPRPFVFAAGEATIARAIRRHARRERGLPAARAHVFNYWKIGAREGDFAYCA